MKGNESAEKNLIAQINRFNKAIEQFGKRVDDTEKYCQSMWQKLRKEIRDAEVYKCFKK